MLASVRALLGVIVKDLPRYLAAFASGKKGYLRIHNRAETLISAPDNSGYRCDWKWTSDLHASKVIPALGRALFRNALDDRPIAVADAPRVTNDVALSAAKISFVIGHRGLARLPHLLATLETIAAQEAVCVECIVVEQDTTPTVRDKLPAWVRHIHTPPPLAETPYNRSWAFNVGAKAATSDVLVLHDNDLLVPAQFSKELLSRVREGYELINAKRYIFYLSEADSLDYFGGDKELRGRIPESVMQNAEGGGSIAITKAAFDRIGGMDEAFVGWGGEDNEFWERATTCKSWLYGDLSLVHLWHPSQPRKRDALNPTAVLYESLSRVPPDERIRSLRERDQGRISSPFENSETG
jgi:GT2 family glycosyltransferase